jgi:hypothetical protein
MLLLLTLLLLLLLLLLLVCRRRRCRRRRHPLQYVRLTVQACCWLAGVFDEDRSRYCTLV